MSRRYSTQRPVNGLFWIIIGGLYVGFVILFGWQTYSFLDWLLPGDQWIMKALGVFSLDGMALVWCCLSMWYSFSSRGAKLLVNSAWCVTFILALLASVEFMNVEFVQRFNFTVQPWMITTGDAVSLFALTLNLLCIVFFVRQEFESLHPHRDLFEHYEALNDTSRVAAERDARRATVSSTTHLLDTGHLYNTTPVQSDSEHVDTTPVQHDSELDTLRRQVAQLTAQVSRQQSTRQSTERPRRQPTVDQGTPRGNRQLQYAQAKKLYGEGRNKTEIAEIIGVSRSTVVKWLKGA